MSMPYYVPPEQLMKDRADFARKGIARGRSVIVLGYDKGIAFVAENPSRALHKVSEIYDRIAFAAVGRYNEFESLRVAGIRYADLRGYSYDRADVTARALANSYAQTIGAVFTQEQKPFEIEIVVAEVGASSADDQIFRLTYDGSVADEQGFVAMGGASDQAEERLGGLWHPGMPLGEALRVAVDVLGSAASGPAANGGGAAVAAVGTAGVANGGAPSAGTAVRRDLDASMLEVAVLDRDRPRRTFRRIAGPLLERLLSDADPTTNAPTTDEQHPGHPDLLTGELQPPD
ncbi:proteasome subunit alpha [Terracoccus luteus]|jgi:proteasome alpha subunit|uniref:Proteasome subunit alpha n=1 Tax=Terracoccus luteus TaxID=53356 RepID=A0A495XVP4_9MICO|nr:proteasome subunit alpha [Terracoccus luteus]MBB2987648.1 proteasome alpha subunit [Terracoccus luteus]MCP2173299.1 proteasome alpha subunit [Terracoccus luteus]RKT78042.1 proteasome alpha subunit [Terracoccus luteus]